ncbi:MAG: nucleotide sugar dehydrogenase [Coprothermobacterota bacterium]|nr:nucleotide sugar dehydrogenase [Coprothermobacterota bacterium]
MKILGLSNDQIIAAVRGGQVRIAIFGMGKMGFPLAVAFAQEGANVLGVDPNTALVEAINLGQNPHPLEGGLDDLVRPLVERGKLRASSAPKRADVYITLVPTVLDDNRQPALGILEEVMQTITSLLEPGDLVIEESTLPPGTCAKRLWPVLLGGALSEGQFGFVHAPERTMSGRALEDITGAYPKIVGGIDLLSTEAATALYSVINSKGVIPVSSITAAEAVKVFEGIYRDVNIALANELALLSGHYGLDVIEVIKAANTQPYSHIHIPGAGVGGHCIPVYPYFVSEKPEAELIRLARQRNEGMPIRLVSMALNELQRRGIAWKGAKVLLMGIAFRPGVKEDRYSPFFPARDALLAEGVEVHAWDPLYSEEEIATMGVIPAHSLAGMDVAIVITDHEEFKELDWLSAAVGMHNPVLVDGRFILSPTLREQNLTVLRLDGR